MASILIVDDDPLILRVYEQALRNQGFTVATARDGVEAIGMLRKEQDHPNALVLDLMMPRLSGVDVLKFVRSTPGLASMPVVLLSNSYMGELEKAAPARFERALLKVRCNPTVLGQIIRDLIEKGPNSTDLEVPPSSVKPATPQVEQKHNTSPPASSPTPLAPTIAARHSIDLTPGIHLPQPVAPLPPLAPLSPREEFLERAYATAAELKALCNAFLGATTAPSKRIRAQDLCRRVHFLAAAAGLADFPQLAEAASSVTAFLFEIGANADQINPSLLNTTREAVDFLMDSLTGLTSLPPLPETRPSAFVLTTDPAVGRPLAQVLRHAGIAQSFFQDTQTAVQALDPASFIYFVLDSDMPRQQAWTFRQRLQVRDQPGYPIFLLDRAQYDIRVASPPEPGMDYVLKPVFPMEVSLKIILHWMRSCPVAQMGT